MAQENTKALLLAAAGVGAALAVQEVLRRHRRFDFYGRSVLITGGSRGLGLALAERFAEEGARVALCARDEEKLERARQQLARKGAEVFVTPCDVTDRDQVDDMVREVREHYGHIDVLVNNAGVIQVGPEETITIEDYEQAMRVHFWAPLYTTLAVLGSMKERGEGRIVNIASLGGKISVPHLLPYCSSKFALVGLSEGLRSELMKDGILVTTVCPGLIRTGSPRNASFKGKHREEYRWFAISDNAPGLSVSAERAAHEIVEAARYGEAEVVIGRPAELAAVFHGLFPGLTADLLGVANRILPGPGGIGKESAAGHESESRVTRSILTSGNKKAAVRYNEM